MNEIWQLGLIMWTILGMFVWVLTLKGLEIETWQSNLKATLFSFLCGPLALVLWMGGTVMIVGSHIMNRVGKWIEGKK